ncbi:MAG: hypothetical protein ACD_79C00984G0001 [uncultured bacterium]|nr:MAG: hypothetical protein ACD_79C00984G0001 [uncultured bacterium]
MLSISVFSASLIWTYSSTLSMFFTIRAKGLLGLFFLFLNLFTIVSESGLQAI